LSEPVLSLSRKAMRAIAALRVEFEHRLALRKALHLPPGVLTPLSDEYNARLQKIVREGLSTSEASDVRIKCPDCGREATVTPEVLRWKCVCSPYVVRYSFQTSVEV
jgi:hypothetical protein